MHKIVIVGYNPIRAFETGCVEAASRNAPVLATPQWGLTIFLVGNPYSYVSGIRIVEQELGRSLLSVKIVPHSHDTRKITFMSINNS